MTQNRLSLPKIISGGQTGADQGGLFAAREMGFETGGWAPHGFLTEDGYQPALLESFGLKDSQLDYLGRTKLNAKEADLTIWFGKTGTPGFNATKKAVKEAGKKFLLASEQCDRCLVTEIKSCGTVNIAGNRESINPSIFQYTKDRMTRVLRMVKEKER
jgi:hypothetical protein